MPVFRGSNESVDISMIGGCRMYDRWLRKKATRLYDGRTTFFGQLDLIDPTQLLSRQTYYASTRRNATGVKRTSRRLLRGRVRIQTLYYGPMMPTDDWLQCRTRGVGHDQARGVKH